MTTILALDPGSRAGWALAGASPVIESGRLDMRRGSTEGVGVPYHRLRLWLSKLQERAFIDRVVYEVTPHQKARAAHLAGGWEATITSWCELNGVAYESVNAATIKARVAGIAPNTPRKKAKARMMTAMEARGYRPKSADEADALAILEWALGRERQGDLLREAAA